MIDFVMEYFGLTYRQALVRLNEDFSLGLAMGPVRTPLEQARAAREAAKICREREARENARANAEAAYWWHFARWQRLDRWAVDYRPTTPAAVLHPLYVYALHQLPEAREDLEQAEYVLRELTVQKQRGEACGRSA